MKLKRMLMLVLALLMCATIVSCDVAKPNDLEEATSEETLAEKATTEKTTTEEGTTETPQPEESIVSSIGLAY